MNHEQANETHKNEKLKSSSRFYGAFQLRFAAWNDENWIKKFERQLTGTEQKFKYENEARIMKVQMGKIRGSKEKDDVVYNFIFYFN